MSDQEKEERQHEHHHPHHHNPHKHEHHEDAPRGIHPAWYIVVGGVFIVLIVAAWMFWWNL